MARKSKADIAAEEAERAEYIARIKRKYWGFTVSLKVDELIDLREYIQYLLEQDTIKREAEKDAEIKRWTEDAKLRRR